MNYPMQAYGLGGLNTVQNMSDRNMAETLMANNGQRFAGGGISNIPRMAAGGVPTYTFDPITGKYAPVDAATAASSDVPKYVYDPITQKYTLVTDKNPLDNSFAKDGAGGDGSGPTGPIAPTTPEEFAAQSERNQKFNDLATGLSKMGISSIVANAFNTLFGSQTGAPVTDLGTSLQAAYNQDAANNAQIGAAEQAAITASQMQSMQDAYNADMSAASQGQGNSPGADAASAANSGENAGGEGPSGDGVSLAKGGLSALAQGGISHLGDYSDGGRLLRGPGDGVSDSIPATIANKQPARLADGEFVVPARIVSELGNGSTEAGARKLYQMLARVQNARKKSIGQGRVAVNSRAEKLLPA
jgi:hypothetical protein